MFQNIYLKLFLSKFKKIKFAKRFFMNIKQFQSEFKKIFIKPKEAQIFFAPGRINIIGEHIDYNGGSVMPFAIHLGTYVAVAKRDDDIINFASINYPEKVSINILDLKFSNFHAWANYPKALISTLSKYGFEINCGFDVLYYGDLPSQAGLSSSASIELATAVLLNDLFDFNISMLDLVKYSQIAENNYMGLNCGIMDQFAIGMSKKDNAILLNTKTLEFEYIPLILGDYIFVITNSNKQRKLVDSKYNERLAECKTALSLLQKKIVAENLCDISIEQFKQNIDLIENPIIQSRALHVISEQQRTLQTAKTLKNGELKTLGILLNQSHYSLRNNYDVTGIELDILQQAAISVDGVIGSRMTGAGFGGCTISLMHKDAVENFKSQVYKIYKEKTGLIADFYIVYSNDGARKII